MRRWMALAVAVPMVITGCTATSGEQNTSKNENTSTNEGQSEAGEIKGTLKVVTSRTDADALFEEMEEAFKAKYPDVEDIIWESSPDYTNYISTRMNTTDYGDVLFIPFSMSGEPELYPEYFEPLGQVSDLESVYIDVTEADYEGVAYGLPTAVDFLGIIYNETIFKEAGIETLPQTVEELMAVCEQIQTRTDAIPFYTGYGPRMGIWGGTLSSFGGENFKADTLEKGTAFAEGQPIRQVMDMFYDLSSKGFTEPDPVTLDSAKANQMMADNQLAMRIGGLQDVYEIDALSDASSIQTMPLPAKIDGKISLAFGASDVLGINANSDNKATARAFVEFFIGSESGYASNLGGMSPVKAELTDEAKTVFEESQIVLTAPPVEADVETKYAAIANEVGVARLTDVLQEVVNRGLYPDQYGSYEDYVASLEANWANATKQYEE